MFTFRYKLKLAPPRPLNVPLTVSIPEKQSVSEHIQQFGKLHLLPDEKVFPSFQFLWPQTAKEYFARRLSRPLSSCLRSKQMQMKCDENQFLGGMGFRVTDNEIS